MRMGGLRLSVRTLVSLSVLVATSEAQDAELSAATADRRTAAAQGGNGKYILHSYILPYLLLYIDLLLAKGLPNHRIILTRCFCFCVCYNF